MILNKQEKTAQIYGDIKQNTVGIDAKNVNFITSLLTEKLYSKPIKSFLREIVSNAYDSHVEANTEEPILINICYDVNKNYVVSVRDYGTGLSPERFDAIYKNIGSSTKRESNDYIGALGLGRFSALAVSDKCTIISYYEGIKDVYIMYKDEGTVHIDKINSSETTEHNGIDVSVTIEKGYNNSSEISEGLKALAFFPKVYVNNSTDIVIKTGFNGRIIKKYKNFSYVLFDKKDKDTTFDTQTINPYVEYKILYGKVLYPVRFDSSKVLPYIILPGNNFYLQFNLGELDITPSREALQMTTKTINAIQEKFLLYHSELTEKIKTNYQCDNSFISVLQGIKENNNLLLLDSFDNININLSVSNSVFANILKDFKLNICTKNGKTVDIKNVTTTCFFNAVTRYETLGGITLSKKLKHLKVISRDDRVSIRELIEKVNVGLLFTNTGDKISSAVKTYLKEEYNEFIIVTKSEERKLFQHAIKRIEAIVPIEEEKILLKALAKWYFSRPTISKKTLPKDFIDRWNAEHKACKIKEKEEIKKEEIIFYGFSPYRDSLIRLYSNDILFQRAKKENVYVFDRNSPSISMIANIFSRHFSNCNDFIYVPSWKLTFIATAAKNIPACHNKGMLLEADFFSKENPFFRKLAAIGYWFYKNGFSLEEINSTIPKMSKYSEIDNIRATEICRAYKYVDLFIEKENLRSVVKDYVESNSIDWRFYAKLPTRNELMLSSFLYKTSRIGINRVLWENKLMENKVIPFNIKKYILNKSEINECIKGGW